MLRPIWIALFGATLATTAAIITGCASQTTNEASDLPPAVTQEENDNPAGNPPRSSLDSGSENSSLPDTMQITIGEQSFTAQLEDTPTTYAFIATLPRTFTMSDHLGNEKFSALETALPAGSESPGTIQAGDIMCWQGNTLVAFYETFSNSYGSYARIAHVEDAEDFAAALSSDSVEVTFTV